MNQSSAIGHLETRKFKISVSSKLRSPLQISTGCELIILRVDPEQVSRPTSGGHQLTGIRRVPAHPYCTVSVASWPLCPPSLGRVRIAHIWIR